MCQRPTHASTPAWAAQSPYPLAVPIAYVGTMMGAELQRAITILGINPQTASLSHTSPTAVAPDSGDAPQILAGDGYSAVVELLNPGNPVPRTPDRAAVAAAGAPGAAPLFRSFQAQRLQSAGGTKKQAGVKKRKGRGKKKGKKRGKNTGTAESARLAAGGGQPAQGYSRPANAAIGIQALARRQLLERARQSSQVCRPP